MHDKKKILYIITKSTWGGAQSYVYDLATSLPKDTFETVVALGQGGTLQEKLNKVGVRTILISSLNRNINPLLDLKSFFELFRILWQEKPDVIHLNSSKIGGLGALAGRVHNLAVSTRNFIYRLLSRLPFPKLQVTSYPLQARIIFTGHGWAFNEDRGFLARKFILFLHWLMIVLAHKVIAVSEKTKRDIAWLPFTRNKITVIYNGLHPVALFSKNSARLELSAKIPALKTLPHDTTWIGTISELHHTKGLDLALTAFAALVKQRPSAVFVVIGEGEKRNELEAMVMTLKLEGRVFLPGRIPDARLYLAAFDIFTLTSRTEALPYSVIEAGLAGLPVIATAVGGIPEIVEDMKSGALIQPKNIIEIERALSYLAIHPEKRKRLGEELKKSVKEKFSTGKMLEKTIALYN